MSSRGNREHSGQACHQTLFPGQILHPVRVGPGQQDVKRLKCVLFRATQLGAMSNIQDRLFDRGDQRSTEFGGGSHRVETGRVPLDEDHIGGPVEKPNSPTLSRCCDRCGRQRPRYRTVQAGRADSHQDRRILSEIRGTNTRCDRFQLGYPRSVLVGPGNDDAVRHCLPAWPTADVDAHRRQPHPPDEWSEAAAVRGATTRGREADVRLQSHCPLGGNKQKVALKATLCILTSHLTEGDTD